MTMLSAIILPDFYYLLPEACSQIRYHHTYGGATVWRPSLPYYALCFETVPNFAVLPTNAWVAPSLLIATALTGVFAEPRTEVQLLFGPARYFSGQYFCSSFWRYLPCWNYYTYDFLGLLLSLAIFTSMSLARNPQVQTPSEKTKLYIQTRP